MALGIFKRIGSNFFSTPPRARQEATFDSLKSDLTDSFQRKDYDSFLQTLQRMSEITQVQRQPQLMKLLLHLNTLMRQNRSDYQTNLSLTQHELKQLYNAEPGQQRGLLEKYYDQQSFLNEAQRQQVNLAKSSQ